MTSTIGCTATTGLAGTASPSAGETSPAQIGLMPAVANRPIVVETAPLVALALRNVSESLPSSVATLTFSACSGMTSRVTVRPKHVRGTIRPSFDWVDRQHPQVLDDGFAHRAPRQRRVVLERLRQDHVDPVTGI